MKYILILTLILISSCTAQKNVRDYASTISLNLEQLEQNISDFSSQQEALAKGRLRSILEVEATIQEVRDDRDIQMFMLQSTSGTKRVDHFNSVIAASDLMLERQGELQKLKKKHKKAVDEMQAQLDFKTDKIDNVQKALAQYATKAKLKDEVAFYTDFFKAVNEDLKESLKQVEEESTDDQEAASADDEQ